MALNIDPFIGYKFFTPKKTIITVLGKSHDNNRKYVIHCTRCSYDNELFDYPLEMERIHLLRGKIPCGCSLSPKYRENQYKVLCKRIAEANNLQFIGFNEEYQGRNTAITLKCMIHNYTFTDSVRGLLRSIKTKCKICNERNTEKVNIVGFNKNKPCFVYVIEMKNSASNKIDFFGVTVTNSLAFYKKCSSSKRYNKDYIIKVLFTRYHQNGESLIQNLNSLVQNISFIDDGELKKFEPTQNNLDIVLECLKN